MPDIPTPDTPFPTLMLDAEHAWSWPHPPFAQGHLMTPLDGGLQACRIETRTGTTVEGHLVHFDLDASTLRFCLSGGGDALAMPFSVFRRLTLTVPWPLAGRGSSDPVTRAPVAVQERRYDIALAGGGELSGQTLGHVQAPAGIFLFAPLDDGAAVLRIFVPQAACESLAFGKTAEEEAAERWIATPDQLFAALEAQRTAPVKPLGDALVDLGFVTRGVLEHAVSGFTNDRERPLGEELVAAGLLARGDLQTALAHKMGYPLVDLSRFPIDVQAARKLPLRLLIELHVFPLLQSGDRLIVAIDDLARVARLQAMEGLAGLRVVPVLASRGHIGIALAGLPQRLGTDHWADNVPTQAKHAPPTAPGDRHGR